MIQRDQRLTNQFSITMQTGRILWGCWRRVASAYAGTTWEPCNYICVCGCKSCWKCCNAAITFRIHYICTECTDHLVLEETEYRGISIIWQWVRCFTNLQGPDCGFAIQAEDVWYPNWWTSECVSDNRGVVKNASIPESTLMKRHNSINYQAVREAAAADIQNELGKRMVIRILQICWQRWLLDRSDGTYVGI